LPAPCILVKRMCMVGLSTSCEERQR